MPERNVFVAERRAWAGDEFKIFPPGTSIPVAVEFDDDENDTLVAAAEVRTGAMIALVPSQADLERLAVPDGEEADQLHLTLAYLGDAVDIPEDVRETIIEVVADVAASHEPLGVDGFAVAMFNPPGTERDDGKDRDACVVLEVSGDGLAILHDQVVTRVEDVMRSNDVEFPEQHTPWIPHVTLLYTDDADLTYFTDRTGPITFDAIRVVFAGETFDIPLGDGEEIGMIAETDGYAKEKDVNIPTGPGHQLRDYWIRGEGAAKIRWGTEGDFTRCVRNLRKHVKNPEGLCAEYHHQATGMWPGDKRNPGMEDETVALNGDVLYGSINGEEDTVPWHIETKNGQHCVVKDADNSVVHCHDSREKATAQIRALYANEPDMRNVVRSFADDAKEPYGDVTYADPGYQGDGRKRYPLDNDDHIRAAWSYINMPKNAGKYAPDDLAKVKKRIKTAMGRIGADVNAADEQTLIAAAVAAVSETELEVVDEDEAQLGDTASWEGVLTVEGIESGDGRMFAENSLTWDIVPFPLMWQKETSHGGSTDKSVRIGSVTEVWREPDPTGRSGVNFIKGRGAIDLGSSDGTEAYRRMKKGFLVGNSVDVDSVKDASIELVFPENPEPAGDGQAQMGTGAFFTAPEMTVYHKGRIRATTMVEIPAFTEARLELSMPADGNAQTVTASDRISPTTLAIVESLTAASTIHLAEAPPREWFDEPTDVEPLGALTITAEGRIYGYVAPTGVRHRSFSNRVVHVPMRNVDYTRFHGGETIVADGSRVVTGPITMNCNHLTPAFRELTVFDAMEHYENSCSIVASVRVGENEHGVWVAGALLPDVTAGQVTRMMACRLSGDWRPHLDKPGWREFAGALLVPVPGFPMARVAPSVGIADGQLVASAVPVEFKRENETPVDHRAVAEFIAKRIGRDPASRVAELRSRVNATRVEALRARVRGFHGNHNQDTHGHRFKTPGDPTSGLRKAIDGGGGGGGGPAVEGPGTPAKTPSKGGPNKAGIASDAQTPGMFFNNVANMTYEEWQRSTPEEKSRIQDKMEQWKSHNFYNEEAGAKLRDFISRDGGGSDAPSKPSKPKRARQTIRAEIDEVKRRAERSKSEADRMNARRRIKKLREELEEADSDF